MVSWFELFCTCIIIAFTYLVLYSGTGSGLTEIVIWLFVLILSVSAYFLQGKKMRHGLQTERDTFNINGCKVQNKYHHLE